MTNYGSILLVLVSVGSFLYATKELLSGSPDPAMSLRGRRLLQDPRTVTMKPDYAQLQNAASNNNMGTLSQQSIQNFGQQIQQAQAETAAVDNIMQTVAQGGGMMTNDNALTNDLSGNMQQTGGGSSMLQQQQTGGMQKQKQGGNMQQLNADPSSLQQTMTGGSTMMQQGGNSMSSGGGMTGDSMTGDSSSSLMSEQDPSSSMLSQQQQGSGMDQTGGQQMMQQQGGMSMEQQGGDSSTMMAQQDPYGSTVMQDSLTTSGGSGTKKLEFIHITKSGGSAVEKLAAENNIMWGACHYWKIPYLGCETPDWDFPKKRRVDRMPAGLTYQGEPWHAPPHWNDPNMMEGSDTFLIIRNPVRAPLSRFVAVKWCSLKLASTNLFPPTLSFSKYSTSASFRNTTAPHLGTRVKTVRTPSSLTNGLVGTSLSFPKNFRATCFPNITTSTMRMA